MYTAPVWTLLLISDGELLVLQLILSSFIRNFIYLLISRSSASIRSKPQDLPGMVSLKETDEQMVILYGKDLAALLILFVSHLNPVL